MDGMSGCGPANPREQFDGFNSPHHFRLRSHTDRLEPADGEDHRADTAYRGPAAYGSDFGRSTLWQGSSCARDSLGKSASCHAICSVELRCYSERVARSGAIWSCK